MGRAFHKQCFKCCQCSKALDSFTANDHKGSLYCKSCYAKNYGPNSYGFSTNGTLMRSIYDLRVKGLPKLWVGNFLIHYWVLKGASKENASNFFGNQ
ncbi:putative crp3/crip3 [Schistosoma mansoni]|uniref:putative crp3/crip3 n=1 Tax=Schistosoma mansoni TaxID=6183 RepID=UPI0001A625FF|nr:putative crp3/crip3 [Schistosoma mansoni]|eukprot:XP_018652856.1 putative crp3/crip3 [Schistosoma mansoni]